MIVPCLGKDMYAEARVDFKVDESSDVPILDDSSSSPLFNHQDPWLVGTDIDNIERYGHTRFLFGALAQRSIAVALLMLC